MQELLESLRADIAALKLDVMLMSHDITKIREQLEKQQQSKAQETVGIVPVPPPDFYPPEIM